MSGILQGWLGRTMRRLLPAAALAMAFAPAASRASTSLPAANERNAPLIMENADRFEGSRSRGEYVLSGKVRFRHGQMLMETERAVWMKDRNIVTCESGMRLTSKGSLLTADRGTYDKNLGQATAQGNVFMRDSSGENVATGQSVVYLRFRHLATLTGNPEVRRFYVKKDSADTASAAGPEKNGPDTLSIKGDIMTYNDSLQVAVADGNVRITRDKLKITCKKAEYHDASDSLYLLGEPQVVAGRQPGQGRRHAAGHAWRGAQEPAGQGLRPSPFHRTRHRHFLRAPVGRQRGFAFPRLQGKGHRQRSRSSRTPRAPTSKWTSPTSSTG